jgi:hypothetical protein
LLDRRCRREFHALSILFIARDVNAYPWIQF